MVLLAAGVPEIVAVPLPLSLKVTPLGRVPVSVRLGVGEPVVVTVKLPALPVVKVVLAALVMAGAVPVEATVSVKLCVTVPAELVAVMVMEYNPAVPEAGVPETVAVPLPLSVKVTPEGRAPVSERAGGGEPLAVTVKEPLLPTVKVALDALLMVGAVDDAEKLSLAAKAWSVLVHCYS